MSRRWRNPGMRPRRRFDPPWLVAPVPGFRDPSGWRPRWLPRLRAGQIFDVPPPPVVAPPSAWVPRLLGARRLVPPLVRRGEFQPVPAAGGPIPGAVMSRRRLVGGRRDGVFQAVPSPPDVPAARIGHAGPRPAVARGGVFLPVPPAVITPAGTGPLPPAVKVSRRLPPASPVRRGDFQMVPLQGVLPGPAPLIPARLGSSRRGLPAARGGSFLLVPSAPVVIAAVWAPDPLGRSARPAVGANRRGRFWLTSPPPAAMPTVFRVRRPPAVVGRGGVFLPVPPQPMVVVDLLRQAGGRSALIRRGRFQLVPALATQAVPAPLRHRGRRSLTLRSGLFWPLPVPGGVVVSWPWPPTAGSPQVVDVYRAAAAVVVDGYTAGVVRVVDRYTAGPPEVI